MQKQKISHAVVHEKGIVQKIGKSSMLHPTIHYNGAKTKWFDDSKLLKKEVSQDEEIHS